VQEFRFANPHTFIYLAVKAGTLIEQQRTNRPRANGADE
jgi:hypothetical protein